MIYTRNKEGFKTKTTKTGNSSSSNRPQTISENGLNLVEELRKRIENKNKKTESRMGEDTDQNPVNRPKSSPSKKLTISKNFVNVHENEEINANNVKISNQVTGTDSSSISSANNANPFSKIKKDTFFQLIQQPQSLPSNVNQSSLTRSPKTFDQSSKPLGHLTQIQDHLNERMDQEHYLNQFERREQPDTQTLSKPIYQSPIQALNQSNYSNQSSNDKGRNMNQSQGQLQSSSMMNSKQMYENKVKKWKDRTSKEQQPHPQQRVSFKAQYSTHHHHQTPFHPPSPTLPLQPTRHPKLSLTPKAINETIINQKPVKASYPLNISPVSAQQEYLDLLQGQISTLKQQISKSTEKVNQLSASNDRRQRLNEELKGENRQLRDRLGLTQKQLIELSEQKLINTKYQRLFSKMRNLLIINAMELIESKNFLQLNFIQSNCPSLANSPQVSYQKQQINRNHLKMSSKTKKPLLLDLQDCESRIQSINECIARVEQTIEVSQKVVSLNHLRQKIQTNSIGMNKEIEVKQLQETVLYKDKIIKKLKEEIAQLKKASLESAGQKILEETRQHKLSSSLTNKTYSYVDQIHLLRHEINRLTQQNCVFYEKFTSLKNQLLEEDKENRKKFPNQSRILEIETLIHKLDKNETSKHQSGHEIANSKLEYWVNTGNKKITTDKKTHHYGSPQLKSPGVSKKKTKQDCILLQKPKPSQMIKPYLQKEKLQPGQQRVVKHSKEKYTTHTKNQKIQYSKEEFSQLVKQFKSSLSGLTPQKRSVNAKILSGKKDGHKASDINNSGHKNDDQAQIIELPTFRTPNDKQNQLNQSNFQAKVPQFGLSLEKSEELIQQSEDHFNQQISDSQNPTQTISRLQYEKEFLASERQTLIKENQKLIERIKQLEKEQQGEQKVTLMKEQLYKLKFQNQELVDRVVEAENLLMAKHEQGEKRLNQAKRANLDEQRNTIQSLELTRAIQSKQHQVQNLMKENIELHKIVQTLQSNQQQLVKTLQSTKNSQQNTASHQQDESLNYTFAPSFESLLNFLRKLPAHQQEYHQILLKLIEGYEKKVSLLRQENVLLKTRHKELQDVLCDTCHVMQKIYRFFSSDKSLKQSFEANVVGSEQWMFKLSAEIRKQLISIEHLTTTYFSKAITPQLPSSLSITSQNSSNTGIISSYQSKINYHLMLLRSLIQGIGKSDLELIESELADYLKQLKYRIPTVLEREEYEESCQSSLNASVVEDRQIEDGDDRQ